MGAAGQLKEFMPTIEELKRLASEASSGLMPSRQKIKAALNAALDMIEQNHSDIAAIRSTVTANNECMNRVLARVTNIEQSWGAANLKEVAL